MNVSTGYTIAVPTLTPAPVISTGYSAGTTLALTTFFAAITTGMQFLGRMASTTGAIATGRYRH